MFPPSDSHAHGVRTAAVVGVNLDPRLLTALTPREKQILEFVAAGYSNLEIGAHLTISKNGVKYHLKSIFQKLGARRRSHAVALARKYGLLASGTGERPSVRLVK